MAELTSTPLVELPAGPLRGAARIAGRGGFAVVLHPGPAGFVVVEAVSAGREIALTLEIESDDDLPLPIGLDPGDLLAVLTRKRGGTSVDRVRIEQVHGADPGDGDLLVLRPLLADGSQGSGLVVVEATPLHRLSLPALPGPFHDPAPALPDPVLLDLTLLIRLLRALEDAKVCTNGKVEAMVLLDQPAVGLAFRPWSDVVAGSGMIARCIRAPMG